jgi:hypothetical protein
MDTRLVGRVAAPTAVRAMRHVRVLEAGAIALVGFALDVGETSAARAAHLVRVDDLVPLLLLAPVVPAAFLAHQILVGYDVESRPRSGRASALLGIAAAWFVFALARHLIDLTATWRGIPVRGGGHVLWDAAFHAPQVVLLSCAVVLWHAATNGRWPPSGGGTEPAPRR